MDKDCQRGDGRGYYGNKDTTERGSCRAWNDKRNYEKNSLNRCSLLKHGWIGRRERIFISGYFQCAYSKLGNDKRCRNPGPAEILQHTVGGAWCYTKHGWGICDIRQCEPGCDKGKDSKTVI